MRSRTLRSLGILWFSLLAAFPSSGQSSSQNTTSVPSTEKENALVAGTVLRLDTGEPLKKAKVHLESHSGSGYEQFFMTDEQGHFSFENVPPGSYDFEVFRNGFVTAEYGQKKPGAPGAILSLESGQRMTEIVFKLARTASISGHVFDEDGEPVAKAEVIAYLASKHPGKERRTDNDSLSTNDLGEFRIFDLAPGRYFVAVNYRTQERAQYQSRTDVAEAKYNPGYLPTYYPNTTDAGKAQAISVGPGDEIRSVDFILQPTRLVSVSGKVINATGENSARWAAVSLIPRSEGLGDAVQDLRENFNIKDGKFSIRDVPPGSYDLVVMWAQGSERSEQVLCHPLDIGSTDLDNVTVTIAHGVDISGRVIWEGPRPPNTENLFIRLYPPDSCPFAAPDQVVKPDGTFRFKDVSNGSYTPLVILPGPQESFYLKTIRYGSAAASDTNFTVEGASDATLELVLSSRPSRVNGVVLNADSLPAVGVKVVLVPDEAHRGLKRRFKAATTDQNGRFSIIGVAPGDYKAFSWDSVEESDGQFGEDWFDPEWLKPYEARGEPVHLQEGDQKTLSLKLLETVSDAAASN